MFDVPPPYEGVRGIDAYRDTWPGFFEWQARGATFEIVSLEVTAGEDVAFAYALLRCGTPGARGQAREPPAADARLAQGRRAVDRGPRAPLLPDRRSQLVERPARGSVCSTISASGSPAFSTTRYRSWRSTILFRFEDLVTVEDREAAWIAADALVFRAGELNELVAAQSAALADERPAGPIGPWPASIPSLTLRKVASFMATRCLSCAA